MKREFNVQLTKKVAPQPHQQLCNNIFKNLHVWLFATAAISFTIPIVTNPILKEDEPELQHTVKTLSYSVMLASALVGLVNESRHKVTADRRFNDMNVNIDYALKRRSLKFAFANKFTILTISSDLENLRTAQSAGDYGLPYYPETLSGIAMNRLQTASHNSNMGDVETDKRLFSVGSFTIPKPTTQESQELDYEKQAYAYIHDRKKRNYLGLLVCGTTGDNKTSIIHRIANSWLQAEPETIFYVCDRKYWSEKDNAPQWRSNWCGLPVYSDLKAVTSPQLPHPSVYAVFDPELETWLEPAYKLLVNRTGEHSSERTADEKLIDSATGKYRPVVIVIDDATSLIDKITDKVEQTRVKLMIDELVTLGRSSDIHLIFISHANTASGTGLSTEALGMLEPIVGTRFCQDERSLTWFKGEIQPVGVQKVIENAGEKKRYFATKWAQFPYIPPASYSDRGLLDCVIPELTVIWHTYAPDGFLPQEYHAQVFEKFNYDFETRTTKILDTQEIVNLDESEQSQVDSLTAVRNWYLNEVNRIGEVSNASISSKIIELFNVNETDAQNYLDDVKNVCSLSNEEFQKQMKSLL
jgi:hypothetical protein